MGYIYQSSVVDNKSSRGYVPLLSTHGTQLVGYHVWLVEPFFYAMDVETVSTTARDQGTIVAGCLTVGTTIIEGIPTNATILVLRGPFPCGYTQKTVHLNVHYGLVLYVSL